MGTVRNTSHALPYGCRGQCSSSLCLAPSLYLVSLGSLLIRTFFYQLLNFHGTLGLKIWYFVLILKKFFKYVKIFINSPSVWAYIVSDAKLAVNPLSRPFFSLNFTLLLVLSNLAVMCLRVTGSGDVAAGTVCGW